MNFQVSRTSFLRHRQQFFKIRGGVWNKPPTETNLQPLFHSYLRLCSYKWVSQAHLFLIYSGLIVSWSDE